MLSRKKLKKIAIILGVIFLILWFGGNWGLYLYMNHVFDPEAIELIDYTPEKLKLEEADIDAETLHLMGVTLNFPFFKEDIDWIMPSFDEPFTEKRKLYDATIKVIYDDVEVGTKGVISFSEYSNNWEDCNLGGNNLLGSIWDRFQYANNHSRFDTIKAAHYTQPSDYSWWNLPHNIRLFELSLFKLLTIPAHGGNLKVYDVETPYLNGILLTGDTTFILDFEWKDNYYSIYFHGLENHLNKVRPIIPTIQPIDNIEESYKEMEAMYKDKENAPYPEELILLSMISLKPTVENLTKYRDVLESRNDDLYIDDVNETIEALSKQ
jgi:hypothetical protein